MKVWVQVPQHSQELMENELLLGTITLIGALSVILYIGYDVWTM